MRTVAVSLCVLLLFLILPANPARSDVDVALLVSSGTRYKGEPAVSGSRLVWLDERDRTHNIYLYDLDTRSETRITNTPGDRHLPDISGDKIVWRQADQREGDTDIFCYDLATGQERAITADQANQSAPRIDNGRIVWMDDRNGNWDIYMYDLATETETRITNNAAHQRFPAISGDTIAWIDFRTSPAGDCSSWDIYAHDLTTGIERRVTSRTASLREEIEMGSNVEIDQHRVVWSDMRNGTWDVFMYDLATGQETPIATGPAEQRTPHINGNKIVWSERGNTGTYFLNLCMLDLSTSVKTSLAADRYLWCFQSDVGSDKIVWSELKDNSWCVYARDLAAQPVYTFRWLVPDKYIYKFTLSTADGQFVVNENLKVVIEGNGVTEEFGFDRGSEDVRIDTADSQYLIHVHIHKIDSVERAYTMSVYFDGIKYGETEVLLKGQEPPGQLPQSPAAPTVAKPSVTAPDATPAAPLEESPVYNGYANPSYPPAYQAELPPHEAELPPHEDLSLPYQWLPRTPHIRQTPLMT